MKDSRSLSILFLGGRAYPVRHYPIAIRLRDRKGRAILCIALFPQSGDSSGAILGVRSVALLHVIDSGKIRKDWVKIVHIELRILNFEGKSCVYLKKIVPLWRGLECMKIGGY